jgi:valyl-tRNA synthetase
LWHLVRNRKEGEDIIVASWPKVGPVNEAILEDFKVAAEVISNIRNVRKANNIANKIKVDLHIAENAIIPKSFDSLILKMGNLQSMNYTKEKVTNAYSFIVRNVEFFIPFGDNVDVAAEREKIEEELGYTKGFLMSVQKKLSNEKFVSGAPDAVVASERKKEADALEKIRILEEKLTGLN